MNSQESKKLEKKILDKLQNHLEDEDTVIAGISGGPDSIFLLHFLGQIKNKVIVAHLNHMLRKESDAEEKFVREVSKKFGQNLIFHSQKTDISKLSQKTKKGLEESGRHTRYEFFHKLAKKHHAKYILTAHHADDNLETIILNFARGAGLQGLSGMPEMENQLFRPLLSISKKQILAFLKFHKISFKIDKSNRDIKFKRNYIRHKIIPSLEKINPSLTETVTKNAEEIRSLNQYLKELAQNWLGKNSISINKLNAKFFRQQHPSLQKMILFETHKNITGNTLNIENIHLNEVVEMINKNLGNKKKKLGLLTVEIKNNIIGLKK